MNSQIFVFNIVGVGVLPCLFLSGVAVFLGIFVSFYCLSTSSSVIHVMCVVDVEEINGSGSRSLFFAFPTAVFVFKFGVAYAFDLRCCAVACFGSCTDPIVWA